LTPPGIATYHFHSPKSKQSSLTEFDQGKVMQEVPMRRVQRPLSIFAVVTSVLLLQSLVAPAGADEGVAGWPQWAQNPQHQGFVSVAGQPIKNVLANIVYDPNVPAEQASQGGDLLTHYQAPLISGSGTDVFMEFKSGSFNPSNFATQVWHEKRLTWSNNALVTVWDFISDWSPEPDQGGLGGWEPVFHAALVGGTIYVPGRAGTVFKLDAATGKVLTRINPFKDLDNNRFVAGVLSADSAGNIYYNAVKLDPNDPWGFKGADIPGSWLVRVNADGTTQTVSYRSLVPNPPSTCFGVFGSSQLPWPPSTTAVPRTFPCLSPRPGINVAPAIAPDGTVYSVARVHNVSRYSWVVAANADLSPKWATSLRDFLNDGCGVLVPIATTDTPQKGACRFGANVGVDPSTNQRPAGRVIDQSSSSPTVAPDGSVIYGSYSRYNIARGHLWKLEPVTGRITATYDFGWDSTPAILQNGSAYSIVIKDNHYDEEGGFYCSPNPSFPVSLTVCAFTGIPAGPFYITQLDSNLVPQWKFQNVNTQSCVRTASGALSCSSNPPHPNGFEWCINAPAIDGKGVVYANSEDGNLYTIPQGRTGVFTSNDTTVPRIFTNLALGAAYTPLAIGPDGLIYTENDGHLFVVGIGPGGAQLDTSTAPTSNPPPTTFTGDAD